MSDVDGKFEKWDKEGKYLVGLEVNLDAVASKGWTKWNIPAFEYLTVICTTETYGETLKEVLKNYMPEHDYSLVGAIQEYYSSKIMEGEMYLYFPIKRL